MSARVLLGDTTVGVLTSDPSRQCTTFELDTGYLNDGARPILGRWFEDQNRALFSGTPLPAFFRNLLPEGALRKIVEKRLGRHAVPEYAMLLRLGEHLPGAIRVLGDDTEPSELETRVLAELPGDDPFRFSLTGVQPKLSLSMEEGRLTVPLEGDGGYWVAKFGTADYRDLVANEHTTLTWAAKSGLAVPDYRVIRAGEIARLPVGFEPEQDVLLVRRFDRSLDGVRIHQEDFAQVFDVPPEDKYADDPDLDWINYGSIGAVIFRLCGRDDFIEYMRRLAFMVLSGNADAHLKNWSLYYPSPLVTRLAPLYDVVATVAYSALDTASAMHWIPPAEPMMAAPQLRTVTMDHLLQAASLAEGVDTSDVRDELLLAVARIRSEWSSVAACAPSFVSAAVAEHLRTCALVT